MTATKPSLDDVTQLDAPEHFAEAAEAFVGKHIGPVTAHHVAKALSWLARCGYVVSAAEHDRVCADYAARLAHVEQAADELAARIDDGDHGWVEGL